MEVKKMIENSLRAIAQVIEVYSDNQVNRLLQEGWKLLYITTITKRQSESNVKALVYILGKE